MSDSQPSKSLGVGLVARIESAVPLTLRAVELPWHWQRVFQKGGA